MTSEDRSNDVQTTLTPVVAPSVKVSNEDNGLDSATAENIAPTTKVKAICQLIK